MKSVLVLLSLVCTLQAYSEENLDRYLINQGCNITEGYCTRPQEEQFAASLKSRAGQIRQVAEIGFNAGHSAEFFLKNCPQAILTSFDINHHPYTKVGVKYIQEKYKNRLNFIEGNSVTAVPLYSSAHPSQTFDLIYVDGDHSFTGCLTDIMNCRALANKDTVVWIDDYNDPSVAQAVQEAVKAGVIKVVENHKSYDHKHFWREWIEARYVTKT